MRAVEIWARAVISYRAGGSYRFTPEEQAVINFAREFGEPKPEPVTVDSVLAAAYKRSEDGAWYTDTKAIMKYVRVTLPFSGSDYSLRAMVGKAMKRLGFARAVLNTHRRALGYLVERIDGTGRRLPYLFAHHPKSVVAPAARCQSSAHPTDLMGAAVSIDGPTAPTSSLLPE